MLLERSEELSVLRAAVRAAQEAKGSTIVVAGQLGSGKTALLQSFAALAADLGAVVLRASASPVERDYPYGVVRQLLEPLATSAPEVHRDWLLDFAGDLAGDLAADRPRRAATHDAGPAAPPGAHRPEAVPEAPNPAAKAGAAGRVARSVGTAVARAAEREPVVVLVDDVQWADEASLVCLAHLAARTRGGNLCLVASALALQAGVGGVRVRHLVRGADRLLTLRPLSQRAVRSLVTDTFGEPPSDGFAAACRWMSGGNPLLLRAVLAELMTNGHRPTDEAVDQVYTARPGSLRDRLFARIRVLPTPLPEVLRALGCLGEVAPELAGPLAGLDPVGYEESCAALRALGLLGGRDTPEPVHPVVLDAVERATTAAEADALHLSAARLLYHAGYPAHTAGEHLLDLPARQDAWVVSVLRAAADSAAEAGDVRAAARFLRRALLEVEPEGGGRGELLLRLAEVERATDASASVRHVIEAVDLADTPWAKAQALTRLSPLPLGSAPPSLADVLRAVSSELGPPDRLGGADRELALRLEARLRAAEPGDPHEVESAAHRLFALDQAVCLDSAPGRELLCVLLEFAALSGRVPAAEVIETGRRLLACEPATRAYPYTALPMAATALVLAGQPGHVAGWLEGMAGQEGTADALLAPALRATQALTQLAAGRFEEGTELLLSCVAQVGPRCLEILTTAGLLRAAVGRQLDQTNRAELAEAVLAALDGDSRLPALSVVSRIASASRAVEQRDFAQAGQHVLDLGRQLERAGWTNPAVVPWRSYAALIRHRAGEPEAAELAAEEFALAARWGEATAMGRALRVRGTLTPGEEGIAQLRDALDILEDSPDLSERGRAHLLLGNRLAKAGVAYAEVHMRQGRALLDDCGPSRTHRQEGAPLPPGPNPRSGVELTNAERRVVELAVAGLTNQAIADELEVSCRAVEKHLTSTYRKLDVAGRHALKDVWPLLSPG